MGIFRPTGGALTVGLSMSCSLGFMLFGQSTSSRRDFVKLIECRIRPRRLRRAAVESIIPAAVQSAKRNLTRPNCLNLHHWMHSRINHHHSYRASILDCHPSRKHRLIHARCNSDQIGRCKSVMLGCLFVSVGGLLQASSFTLPHMIIGRIISGIGIGINTTTIPMWQSETCKASLRGKLVAIQLTTLVFGFVLTNWMNFGFTYVDENEVSWRFPLAFQALLGIGTAALVPFLVESPRWLCLKDRHAEAKTVIARLYAKSIDDSEVRESLEIMIETLARERAEGQIGFKEIFRNGPQ